MRDNSADSARHGQRILQLSALMETTKSISSPLDLEDVLALIAQEMVEASGVDGCTISRWQPEEDAVVTCLEWRRRPLNGSTEPGTIFALEDYPATRAVLETRQPVAISISDPGADWAEVALLHTLKSKSLLMLPLVLGDRTIGLVELDTDEAEWDFTAADIRLCQALANLAALAIENAWLYQKAEWEISERKRLEEQLRSVQKMESLGRLAGGIAHNLNNLLTVMHLSTRLLEEQLSTEAQALKHVQRIDETVQRVAELTRQLVSFSRREVVEPRVVNLNSAVRKLNQMVRRIIGEDIKVVMILAEALWQVKMDPSQIEQVILNLVFSARSAMPAGGTLTIETANATLDENSTVILWDSQPGEYVVLSISDTGETMDEETRARIFEPYYGSESRGTGSGGLGLATVYGIVKQNGGHVWADSGGEYGTTFRVCLPRTTEREVPFRDLHGVLSEGQVHGKGTVLLVEDEKDVRDLAEYILRSCGYQILTAENGPEALRVSEKHNGPIHLLLTDVVMPEMYGPELAERLQPLRPEMRVLYMSGYTDGAIKRHGVQIGRVAFVPKPLTVESLTQSVRSALNGHAATDRRGLGSSGTRPAAQPSSPGERKATHGHPS